MSTGDTRSATVRATEECMTWALDRDTFRKIMMQSGKSTMSERVTFLNKVRATLSHVNALLHTRLMHSTESYPNSKESYPHSKESYLHSKESYPHSKESYQHSKESYPHSKETYQHSKETYQHSKETYPHSKETYPHSKETYQHSKETYQHSKETYPHINIHILNKVRATLSHVSHLTSTRSCTHALIHTRPRARARARSLALALSLLTLNALLFRALSRARVRAHSLSPSLAVFLVFSIFPLLPPVAASGSLVC